VLCVHPDGELDAFAVSDDGARAALMWNAGGGTQLELLDLGSGRRLQVLGGPETVERVRFSADGRRLVASGQGFGQVRGVWSLPVPPPGESPPGAPTLSPAIPADPLPYADRLAVPTREPVLADDGLRIDGWLFRPPGVRGPMPTVIHLHGGPEAQERPAFTPLFQALVCSGIAVYLPNVRGSSGYGRAFEHADDGPLRFAAIRDVAACALHLLRTGIAEHGRLGCMGRSYGGYLTLAALTWHPELFAAGVDVCGMSDLQTFYANTEPWVAAVAASKYGHPERDADLLAQLSPLRRFDRLRAPLLAVHGENDRNVPVSESVQAVEAARARGVEAELMLFADEGHEIARPEAKLRFVTAVVDFLTRHLGSSAAGCP
jgi:dipeptidyl aminopeptidase/acylaminoacyl peptidase